MISISLALSQTPIQAARPDLGDWLDTEVVYPFTDDHTSKYNWIRRHLTSLIWSSSSSWREDSWGPLRWLSMMTVILCLLPLPSYSQWWSIANLHDPRVTRTSRSSPPDSVGLVSGLDSNDLLQDLMRWSGGVQSGHVSEQHVTSINNRLSDVR